MTTTETTIAERYSAGADFLNRPGIDLYAISARRYGVHLDLVDDTAAKSLLAIYDMLDRPYTAVTDYAPDEGERGVIVSVDGRHRNMSVHVQHAFYDARELGILRPTKLSGRELLAALADAPPLPTAAEVRDEVWATLDPKPAPLLAAVCPECGTLHEIDEDGHFTTHSMPAYDGESCSDEPAETSAQVGKYVVGGTIVIGSLGNRYRITAVEGDNVTFARPDDPEDSATETIADLDAVDVRVLPESPAVTR